MMRGISGTFLPNARGWTAIASTKGYATMKLLLPERRRVTVESRLGVRLEQIPDAGKLSRNSGA